MAATFRRGKIEDFYRRQKNRCQVLRKQLNEEIYVSMSDIIKGELKALEQVLAELQEEFGIEDQEG